MLHMGAIVKKNNIDNNIKIHSVINLCACSQSDIMIKILDKPGLEYIFLYTRCRKYKKTFVFNLIFRM